MWSRKCDGGWGPAKQGKRATEHLLRIKRRVQEIESYIDDIADGNIGNERNVMFAVVVDGIASTDRTFEAPGNDRAMASPCERTGGEEVAAPIDAHRCRADSAGEVQGAGVIRDDDATAREQTSQPVRREAIT